MIYLVIAVSVVIFLLITAVVFLGYTLGRKKEVIEQGKEREEAKKKARTNALRVGGMSTEDKKEEADRIWGDQ